MTLYDILERMYPHEDERFHRRLPDNALDIQALYRLPTERLDKIRVVWGHYEFRSSDTALHKRFRYFCFLRDPVQRVISLYNYILSRPSHHMYEKTSGLSLKEFARSDFAKEIRNGQAKWIADQDSIVGLSETELFEQARLNVRDHFFMLGITERFDESLVLLKKKLGWSLYPYYEAVNVNRRKQIDLVDEESRAVILENNRVDVGLYNWAVNNFEEEVRRYADFGQELSNLRLLNEYAARWREMERRRKALHFGRRVWRRGVSLWYNVRGLGAKILQAS